MECGPRCWRNRYRREMRWALGLYLVEAQWLDSRKSREEKRAVDVAYAPEQCQLDGVNLAGNAAVDDAVHVAVVPHDFSVSVPGERRTSVQADFYLRKIPVLYARRLAVEKEW